jgi:hypothetical protein
MWVFWYGGELFFEDGGVLKWDVFFFIVYIRVYFINYKDFGVNCNNYFGLKW